ncbi:MAG: hypothetical protein OXK77_07390 [Gemmatimonadota bacterium]|nr:hypothetical protein [Gemmatimonadota bacterium]MDE2782763.1 hypothetical protein [Gemmatimonadota bacterium]MDE2864637.1 hypothetical protein [Gemmatimonadota bacterium]
MPIDPELLEILVCPETKQPLTVAGTELLEHVNAAVAGGSAVTRGGEAVPEPVTEGLLREDGRVLYPIRQGIPIMLIDESIEVGAA